VVAQRLCASLHTHLQELQRLAAWSVLPNPPSGFRDVGSPEQLQRLAELRSQLATLDEVPTLQEVASLTQTFDPLIDAIRAEFSAVTNKVDWLQSLQQALTKSSKLASTRIHSLEQIADQCSEFAEMDFEFLHNKSRDLFAIGFNVSENRIDAGCYDLLASEARLASFVLIAQGHFSQEHWFALGRLLTSRRWSSGVTQLERFDV
jgi:cyclic beta-1,2-glucan synthetase